MGFYMIRFDNHAFKGLDESLKQLYDELMVMGEGATELLALLPSAVDNSGAEFFVQAKEIDKRVNEAELRVDSEVASIINKFTVMGEDLRFILGAVKIAGTLERTADKLKNCVKRLGRVHHPILESVRLDLHQAVTALSTMLPLALTLVIEYKSEVSAELLTHGAVVQRAYRSMLLKLHDHSISADDETHILLVAKNLEQAADMVVEVMKASYYIHFATKYDKRAAANAEHV